MAYPGTISNEHQAMAQIRQRYPEIRQGHNGGYEILLQLQMGALYISLYFPKQFPSAPPSIFVASPVEHALIGENFKINYPEEKIWTSRTPLLAVIQNIHSAFMKDPPRIKPPQQEDLPNFTEILRKNPMPVEDEEDMRDVIYTRVQKAINLTEERDKLLNEVIEKTEFILSKKAEIDKIVNENRSKISEIDELTKQFGRLVNESQQISVRVDQQGVVEDLKRKETAVNQELQDLRKQFMDGEITADKYIHKSKKLMIQSKYMRLIQAK
ncbi:unnamed protein product [Blepharisma stoltei]|uniref:Uncharacterized protein n=1 Tax=Blepharisma stoltei TaxID=1481888 RepID=A0AAU9K2Z9_9CILI|nr:unnamed protein product [Blepharisma stoltei]